MSQLRVVRNEIKKRGVIKYEIDYCGFTYASTVVTNLGGKATLRSLHLLGSVRQTRYGTTRTRIGEIVLPDAEKRARLAQKQRKPK